MKPSDMGTTGLIDWVLSRQGVRRQNMAMGTAKRILEKRGLSFPLFKMAISRIFWARYNKEA